MDESRGRKLIKSILALASYMVDKIASRSGDFLRVLIDGLGLEAGAFTGFDSLTVQPLARAST